MFQILVVDDTAHTRRLMEVILSQNGYHPILAKDGEEALHLMETEHIDLVLLDIMMPRMDGYEFTRLLRQNECYVPILMVTAKDEPADKRKGFLSGTDDYMVKPVDEVEMLLRIQALLRRARIAAEHELVIHNTRLVYDSFTVIQGDCETVLPKKEFQLLFKLLSFPDKTFTRKQLMEEFWAMDTSSEERTVDVHVNRLRERFKSNEDFEIITVRGLGYKAIHK